MAWYRRFVVCWESFVPGGPIGAACWESFIPVRSAGFRVGRALSRKWSCVRYKVLPARLASAVGVKKFSLQARNGLVSPFCGVLGEFCPGWAHRGCLLGEFYTGSIRRVSCGESFVPQVVLCAVQSSPCSACLCRRREKVLPASEKWLGIAVLWCVGRVLSRSSGETARSEGVRGLRGMYLRCRRAAARLESGARPAGPGRASRRRAERSSRRGRRAGGQASRHTEVWRLGASRTASGRAAAHRRIEQTQTTGCAGRDRLLRGPVLLSSHPQLVLL